MTEPERDGKDAAEGVQRLFVSAGIRYSRISCLSAN